MLYGIALVSTKHQPESAISLPMSPPTGTSLPPPTLLGCYKVPANSHWLSILHMVVDVSMLFFLYLPPSASSPPSAVSISLFLMSVSPLLFCKRVHQCHLSRLHICVSVYGNCFSLSDLLHSVKNKNVWKKAHCWAYTPRKPELKETRVPQCSLQHCLQYQDMEAT